MSANKDAFASVSIQPVENSKMMAVGWKVTVLRKNEKDGMISCYIPAFEIYYSCQNEENLVKKAKVLTRVYFDHYLIYIGKGGFKKLVLELHKLGFKANNDMDTVHKLINNKIVPAKFKTINKNVPTFFSGATEEVFESDMAVAI